MEDGGLTSRTLKKDSLPELMGPFSELALVSEHRAGSPILSLVGGLGGPVCGPTRGGQHPERPLTICLQRPLDVSHGEQVSLLRVGEAQLGLHVFWGRGGEVPRVDPAVVQAGTWEQEKQKSEACGL